MAFSSGVVSLSNTIRRSAQDYFGLDQDEYNNISYFQQKLEEVDDVDDEGWMDDVWNKNDVNGYEMVQMDGKSSDLDAEYDYNSNTSIKPRGRGRGRGRHHNDPPPKGVNRFLPKKLRSTGRNKHWPIFTIFITIVDIVFLAVEIGVEGGIEDPKSNPFIGPSVETLHKLGAKWTPDILNGQIWRLLTPIWMHVGIVHLLLNLLTQLKVVLSLERAYGWWRIVPIYILCGIAGNLVSAIFLPSVLTVGASGSLFGFIGVLVIDLIQNWAGLDHPIRDAIFLAVNIVFSLAIGLLPAVDNFAHVGGFIEGLMAGAIFLPSMGAKIKKCHKYLRWILLIVCIPLNIIFFFGLLLLLYLAVSASEWCGWCKLINCIPVLDWCDFDSV